MFQRNTARELTVFITSDEAAFRRVEAALEEDGVRRRVWTTSEYPVLGWTRLDPRLMIRKESRLRTIWHIEVAENDRQNLMLANMAVRRATGRIQNAVPVSEII